MAAQDQSFLSPAQLTEFCRFAGLDPFTVVPRTNGAHRDALMAPDRVYYFPRTPEYAQSMRRELSFLEPLGGWFGAPVPRFLDVLECPSVFAGQIGVVSRLEGDNWEDIQEQFSYEFIEEALTELVELFILWHSTPASSVRSLADSSEVLKFSETPRMQVWLAASLDPRLLVSAVEGLHADILRFARGLDVDPSAVRNDRTVAKWVETTRALASLAPVLLHGDMHEGQILLKPSAPVKISGILDWEAVQFGSPLMDFSFHKWGYGRVWVFRENFPALRRRLWGHYLDRRRITNLSPDSLHLYCTLTETLRTIIEKEGGKREYATATRKHFREGLEEQLHTLASATEFI